MRELIVFVEDNPGAAEVVVEHISEYTDFSIKHFISPEQALVFIKNNHEQVVGIISDMMMGSMDGIEFLSQLRLIPACKKTPFIFLSGTVPSVFSDMLRRHYYNDFIEKPINLEKLLKSINKHFSPGHKASF